MVNLTENDLLSNIGELYQCSQINNQSQQLERSIESETFGIRREINKSKLCPLFSAFIINQKDKDKWKKNKDKYKGNFI